MIRCRSCSGRLASVLELGTLFLSDFRSDDSKPPAFPLDLVRCASCELVQLSETVPRELLYHDRYGYRSGVSDSVRADLASIVARVLPHAQGGRWLDIACNDGTLLSYVPGMFQRFGIDPVAKFTEQAARYGQISCGYWPEVVAPGDFDVITSISVFYDVEDLAGFVEATAASLARRGVWAIQQNYLVDMLDQEALDNICHEHITYFALTSLEHLLHKHGLEVFAAWESTVNGGCFGVLVGHIGQHGVEVSVGRMRERERRIRRDVVYRRFARNALRRADALGGFIRGLADAGKEVYLYGASTRSQTLWQVAGLNQNLTPAAVERNADKVWKVISSLGVPIISESEAREFPPAYMLVGPWYFRSEFVARERAYLEGGGRFIFPLPELEVVSDRDLLSDVRQAEQPVSASV